MRRLSLTLGLVLSAAVLAGIAHAQVPPIINTSPVIPFPVAPPPPPPPQIEVPVVPQMNSPPKFELQNTTPSLVVQDPPPKRILRRQQRSSFSDRVARCLDEGAAMGLGPNRRAAYSRSCANQ